MKILFSVFNEDRDTEERVLKYKTTIETEEKIEEIDSRLQLYDGFHSTLQIATQIGRCGQVNRSELATISGRC